MKRPLFSIVILLSSLLYTNAQVVFSPVSSGVQTASSESSTVQNLTESEYEALTEYDSDVTYFIDNGAAYKGSQRLLFETFTYDPSDIHVAKTGNDGSGDGSFGNPYLTINKAYTELSSDGGETIWVHQGTYSENTGAGYFLKNSDVNSFTERSYIKAVPGDTVIWTNVSGNYLIFINNPLNLTLKGFTFQANSTPLAYLVVNDATCVGVEIIECTFNDNVGTTSYAIRETISGIPENSAIKRCTYTTTTGDFSPAGIASTNFKFIGNTLNNIGTGLANGTGTHYINSNTINSRGNGITASANVANAVIHIKGNTIIAASRGIDIEGGTSGNDAEVYIEENQITSDGDGLILREHIDAGYIRNNTITSDGTHGIGTPADFGDTGLISNLSITGNTIVNTGASGHPVLFGLQARNITFTNNISDGRNGGAYGIVIKGEGHTITNNTFYGGSSRSIYFRAGDDSTVEYNTVYQEEGGDGLFFSDQSSDNPTGNTVRYNTFHIYNEGQLYTSGAIGSGNVVDYNTYYIYSGATFGTLLGETVNSLAEIQSTWVSNYGGVTNDANSTAIVE